MAGKIPLIVATLGACLFLVLRWQRVVVPADPRADEGVYLHVAAHYRETGAYLSNWHFIPRGGAYPRGEISFVQKTVQPGLPWLLSPWAGEPGALDSGRRLMFFLGVLNLVCLALALYKLGGAYAVAAGLLWTGLSFSQLEYGSLIHTETPMSLVTFAALALLLWLWPKHPRLAAGSAAAVSALGLYFRTNGIFLPLALSFCLFLRRREAPGAWFIALLAFLAVAAPMLAYSLAHFGSALASDSGDILWASTYVEFRGLHPAPLDFNGLLSQVGWAGLAGRPFQGAAALAQRIWEMDHGRLAPLLALGLAGFFLRRRELGIQVLAAGALPTLAVALWVSPVSWVERYLFPLYPALLGMAGWMLFLISGKTAERFRAWRNQADRTRYTPMLAAAAILLSALPFIQPHRFYQRKLAQLADPGLEDARELRLRLQEREVFLIGTGFSRFNWISPLPGANRPDGLPVPELSRRFSETIGIRPTHLVLEKEEERMLSAADSAYLANRLAFRAGRVGVYELAGD